MGIRNQDHVKNSYRGSTSTVEINGSSFKKRAAAIRKRISDEIWTFTFPVRKSEQNKTKQKREQVKGLDGPVNRGLRREG